MNLIMVQSENKQAITDANIMITNFVPFKFLFNTDNSSDDYISDLQHTTSC
jgi:hypothetical protein